MSDVPSDDDDNLRDRHDHGNRNLETFHDVKLSVLELEAVLNGGGLLLGAGGGLGQRVAGVKTPSGVVMHPKIY